MRLDLIEAFQDYIDSQNLFTTSILGLLSKSGNSISIMALPNGEAPTIFYDGSRDATYHFQVNLKSSKHADCLNASYKLENSIIALKSLPSNNGSFEFLEARIAAKPTMVTQDEQGFYIYSLTTAIDIHIKKGVDV